MVEKNLNTYCQLGKVRRTRERPYIFEDKRT